MLTHNTLETLRALKLHGMAAALEEQQSMPSTHDLSFEERLALLVDRERLYRDNTRRTRLLQLARHAVEGLRQHAEFVVRRQGLAHRADGRLLHAPPRHALPGCPAPGAGRPGLAGAGGSAPGRRRFGLNPPVRVDQPLVVGRYKVGAFFRRDRREIALPGVGEQHSRALLIEPPQFAWGQQENAPQHQALHAFGMGDGVGQRKGGAP